MESKIEYKIPVRHPIIAWMVRHAANLLTWCARGNDGRTGYQRVKTRDFRTRLMGFGEFCRFKNRSQEPIANVSGGTRSHSGIFLGIDQRTRQYMIYSGDSIKLARTVVRVPTLEKWDRESLPAVKGTPHSLHVPKEMEVVFKDKVDVEIAPEQAPNIARQLYLYPSDFVGPNGFGLSRGCPKCDFYLKTEEQPLGKQQPLEHLPGQGSIRTCWNRSWSETHCCSKREIGQDSVGIERWSIARFAPAGEC